MKNAYKILIGNT